MITKYCKVKVYQMLLNWMERSISSHQYLIIMPQNRYHRVYYTKRRQIGLVSTHEHRFCKSWPIGTCHLFLYWTAPELLEHQEAKRRVRGARSVYWQDRSLEAHLSAHLCATQWQEEVSLHNGNQPPDEHWRPTGAVFVGMSWCLLKQI